MSDGRLILETRRARINRIVDGVGGIARGNPFAEQVTSSTSAKPNYQLLAEDSYHVAQNATPETGIIGHASVTVFDATKPTLVVRNSATAAQGSYIWIDQIHLLTSVVGAAATSHRYQILVDGATRALSTPGTVLAVRSSNTDASATTTSKAIINFGAIVAAAASADVRIVDSGVLRQGVGLAGDQFWLNFGDAVVPQNYLQALTNAMCHVSINVPPVILAPGASMYLYTYGPAQTTAVTYEPKLRWIER